MHPQRRIPLSPGRTFVATVRVEGDGALALELTVEGNRLALGEYDLTMLLLPVGVGRQVAKALASLVGEIGAAP